MPPTTVLTAVTDGALEADLVAGFRDPAHGVRIVRRCLDVADLLAAAAAGSAQVALLSAELGRLDRDAVAGLAVAGVRAVALVRPNDDVAARRLRHIGVSETVCADAGAGRIAAALHAAAAAAARVEIDREVSGTPDAEPAGVRPRARPRRRTTAPDVTAPDAPAAGTVVAVWGPTGAPGRTSVALTLAAETAAAGTDTLLVDADVYGGCVAQLIGVLDESPGLVAAARAANTGALEPAALRSFARTVAPRLHVLTGIVRADRWPELRGPAVTAVLAAARSQWPVTFVDCGFCVEQDEELLSDVAVPRRNGATLAALGAADRILVVGAADPVGVHRLIRALGDLRDTVPVTDVQVVVNRVRRRPSAATAQTELRDVLARFAGVTPIAFVPNDAAAFDTAVAAGRTLTEAVPGSPARAALRHLAAALIDRPAAGRRWFTRARAAR